ncbi:MAG: hypothetical protein ACLFPV_02940, partial [Spirochaetaceae bacterium]
MIQRLIDRTRNVSNGLSFGIALFLLSVIAAALAGCGAAGEDRGVEAEKAVSRRPPEVYPGVLDLPAATAEGFLRCSSGGPDRAA